MKSLQLMIQTYRENPKFGDVKKFEEELELAVFRVQQLQSTLHSLRGQLDDVNLSLENLKVKHGDRKYSKTSVQIPVESTSVSPSHDLMKKTVSEKNIQEVSSCYQKDSDSGRRTPPPIFSPGESSQQVSYTGGRRTPSSSRPGESCQQDSYSDGARVSPPSRQASREERREVSKSKSRRPPPGSRSGESC